MRNPKIFVETEDELWKSTDRRDKRDLKNCHHVRYHNKKIIKNPPHGGICVQEYSIDVPILPVWTRKHDNSENNTNTNNIPSSLDKIVPKSVKNENPTVFNESNNSLDELSFKDALDYFAETNKPPMIDREIQSYFTETKSQNTNTLSHITTTKFSSLIFSVNSTELLKRYNNKCSCKKRSLTKETETISTCSCKKRSSSKSTTTCLCKKRNLSKETSTTKDKQLKEQKVAVHPKDFSSRKSIVEDKKNFKEIIEQFKKEILKPRYSSAPDHHVCCARVSGQNKKQGNISCDQSLLSKSKELLKPYDKIQQNEIPVIYHFRSKLMDALSDVECLEQKVIESQINSITDISSTTLSTKLNRNEDEINNVDNEKLNPFSTNILNRPPSIDSCQIPELTESIDNQEEYINYPEFIPVFDELIECGDILPQCNSQTNEEFTRNLNYERYMVGSTETLVEGSTNRVLLSEFKSLATQCKPIIAEAIIECAEDFILYLRNNNLIKNIETRSVCLATSSLLIETQNRPSLLNRHNSSPEVSIEKLPRKHSTSMQYSYADEASNLRKISKCKSTMTIPQSNTDLEDKRISNMDNSTSLDLILSTKSTTISALDIDTKKSKETISKAITVVPQQQSNTIDTISKAITVEPPKNTNQTSEAENASNDNKEIPCHRNYSKLFESDGYSLALEAKLKNKKDKIKKEKKEKENKSNLLPLIFERDGYSIMERKFINLRNQGSIYFVDNLIYNKLTYTSLNVLNKSHVEVLHLVDHIRDIITSLNNTINSVSEMFDEVEKTVNVAKFVVQSIHTDGSVTDLKQDNITKFRKSVQENRKVFTSALAKIEQFKTIFKDIKDTNKNNYKDLVNCINRDENHDKLVIFNGSRRTYIEEQVAELEEIQKYFSTLKFLVTYIDGM